MSIHRNVAQAVVDALIQIFIQKGHAEIVVDRLLKSNPKWGSRDRRFIAENVYDITRWWRYLHFIIGKDENKTDSDAIWTALGVWLKIKNEQPLPIWQEFNNVNGINIDSKKSDAEIVPKILYSFPDWMDELGQKELGKEWNKQMKALNEPAPLVLRCNTLKNTIFELKSFFDKSENETELIENYPDAIILKKRQNLQQSEGFKSGLFEIQDASSQLVAPFLRVEPGMFVVDACAGAGGKSLHLAALMKNKGKIIALDTEKFKLTELKKRAARSNATIIETHEFVHPQLISQWSGKVDRLLLDVPCTGLGVIRRNADAKWKLTPKTVEELQLKQQFILKNYSSVLKSGGIMVYATCSILPSENQNQIEEFLAFNNQFTLLEERKILPSEGFDGFYMAALLKK